MLTRVESLLYSSTSLQPVFLYAKSSRKQNDGACLTTSTVLFLILIFLCVEAMAPAFSL